MRPIVSNSKLNLLCETGLWLSDLSTCTERLLFRGQKAQGMMTCCSAVVVISGTFLLRLQIQLHCSIVSQPPFPPFPYFKQPSYQVYENPEKQAFCCV